MDDLCINAIKAWAFLNRVTFEEAKARYVKSEHVSNEIFMLAAFGAASCAAEAISK
jgi:hypothetical protein